MEKTDSMDLRTPLWLDSPPCKLTLFAPHPSLTLSLHWQYAHQTWTQRNFPALHILPPWRRPLHHYAFHIHHYFFKCDFPQFKAWFDTSNGTPSQPDRKTLSTAFILDDIQLDEFSDFLWIFYNPTHSLYNTKSHCQWFGILKVAELYTFQSVTELVFQELSNLINNMDTDIDLDTKNITSQTSQSTKYYTTSEGALPQPPAPTPECFPYSDHPYGVDSDGLLYFLTHETSRYIGSKDKEWSQGLHG